MMKPHHFWAILNHLIFLDYFGTTLQITMFFIILLQTFYIQYLALVWVVLRLVAFTSGVLLFLLFIIFAERV